MNRKNVITVRLSDKESAWLGTLCRRSKHTRSEVIRSLLESGTVKERLTPEHLKIVRQLIGESTNLNKLAHQANLYGYPLSAGSCRELAGRIDKLLKLLKT